MSPLAVELQSGERVWRSPFAPIGPAVYATIAPFDRRQTWIAVGFGRLEYVPTVLTGVPTPVWRET